MNIRNLLESIFQTAMTSAGIPAEFNPNIALSKKPEFGDYQANGAMAAAKIMKKPPRDVAQLIIDQLDDTGLISRAEIAGPGFINIFLADSFLQSAAHQALQSDRLGIPKTEQPQRVVVDYSAPNLAKEMHVGHLRSSIIGDAQVRLLEFLGHHVIRQNHIGDWGTQFGMLIAQLAEDLAVSDSRDFQLKDLESFYQRSKAHFDTDSDFADKSRQYVVRLQGGDKEVLKLWNRFIDLSLSHAEEIYQRLNVSLQRTDVMGESAYNDDLPTLVADLKRRNIAVEDQGAQVAFLDEMADKNGNPSPVIIQKQGGGFLYSTTDLAAIRYRVKQLKADRALYFTDARQAYHFKQIFTLAKKAGYANGIELEHCPFGMMLGSDGKPFKTRSGGVVKLSDLLDEAIERASSLIEQKNPDIDANARKEVAQKVAIGAVKYADLSKTRTNDYVFDWNSMLSFEGNTAPYLQYAYTRIRSILRKGNTDSESTVHEILITEASERNLVFKLMQFEEILDQVAKEAMAHVICHYLYDVASSFMSFYESCPILKEGIASETKESRLQISRLCGNTLKQGLDLLGIEVMEKM